MFTIGVVRRRRHVASSPQRGRWARSPQQPRLVSPDEINIYAAAREITTL